MELRSLKSSDMFTMFSILKNIGFSDFKEKLLSMNVESMMKSFKEDSSESDATYKFGFSVVLDIAEVIISNLPKCEKPIYKFLADLTGTTPSDIENLGMVEFTELIMNVIQKEEFKDFIEVVSKFFK